MVAKNAWLFPAPDSPTMPTHSPRPTFSVKSLTAATSPSGVVKVTFKSSRRSTSPRAPAASTAASSGAAPEPATALKPSPDAPVSTPEPLPALTSPPAPSFSPVTRIECIAQAVAHKVEAQEQRHEKHRRHQQHPRRGLHLLRPVIDETAQARERLLNSQPQETQ